MPNLVGVDISNLQGPPEAYRDKQWYRDAQFVIVQAIRPPRSFPGWDVGGYTEAQLRAARQDGKYIGTYGWLWHDQPAEQLKADIRSRLDIVPADLKLDMRPWIDVEDNRPGPSPLTRRADVLIARGVADRWAIERGLPPCGGYSGKWFIDGYLGGWWPEDWMYWHSEYGVEPQLYPMRPIHQYTSTPIDSNEMLETEILTQTTAEVPDPVTDEERAAMQGQIDGLVSALGYVGGDVLKPLTRKSAPAYVKTAVGQIRAVCDQHSVGHA